MSSKYTVRYLDKSEYGNWDLFVDECEGGSIFNKSFWLENLYKYSKNINFKILGCFDKDSNLLGGFSFGHFKKFGLFSIIALPRLTPYSGILIKKRPSKYVSKTENYHLNVTKALTAYLDKNFSQISLILSPNYKDVRAFSWNNYSERVMYTYCANIKEAESLIESFDPDVKRQIKKLEQDEFLIKIDDNIDVFYDLQEKSFKRQERSFNLNKSQFTEFLKNINLENCYKVYTIYQGKTPVYSSIVLLYKSIGYYWLAGGDPNYFAKGHNKLLLKEIVVDLNKKGIKEFDFIGANTPSISKYKSNFGFNLVPYYYVEKANSRILKLLLTIKSIIK